MKHCPYLLYVGDLRPHKNIKLMIDLFWFLKKEYQHKGFLFICGNKKIYDFSIKDYLPKEVIKWIVCLEKISDETLHLLYQKVSAVLLLSKCEGFGLPVIEGGGMGKKMIISNTEAKA